MPIFEIFSPAKIAFFSSVVRKVKLMWQKKENVRAVLTHSVETSYRISGHYGIVVRN